MRLRVAIGAALTTLIFPTVEVPNIDPFTFAALTKMLHEIAVGALMGLTLQVVAAAVILSGQVVSGGMGLGMANMIDPNLGNVPTLANFLLVIGLLAFLSLGGHLVLLLQQCELNSVLLLGLLLDLLEQLTKFFKVDGATAVDIYRI